MTTSSWLCPIHSIEESHLNPCPLCSNEKKSFEDTPKADNTQAGGSNSKEFHLSDLTPRHSNFPQEIKGVEKQQSLAPFI